MINMNTNLYGYEDPTLSEDIYSYPEVSPYVSPLATSTPAVVSAPASAVAQPVSPLAALGAAADVSSAAPEVTTSFLQPSAFSAPAAVTPSAASALSSPTIAAAPLADPTTVSPESSAAAATPVSPVPQVSAGALPVLSPTSTQSAAVDALTSQILNQWKTGGLSGQLAGVDIGERAKSLAQQLASRGVSDLSQLGMGSESRYLGGDLRSQAGALVDWSKYQGAPTQTYNYLTGPGGNVLGYLGTQAAPGSTLLNLVDYAGKGHINYTPTKGPDGQIYFQPKWESSDPAADVTIPILFTMLGGALAPQLATQLGGGILGSAGAGAVMGGTQAALTGQDILKGALTGAAGAGAATGVGQMVSPIAAQAGSAIADVAGSSVGQAVQNAIQSGLPAAARAAVTGGDIGSALATGAAGGVGSGLMSGIDAPAPVKAAASAAIAATLLGKDPEAAAINAFMSSLGKPETGIQTAPGQTLSQAIEQQYQQGTKTTLDDGTEVSVAADGTIRYKQPDGSAGKLGNVSDIPQGQTLAQYVQGQFLPAEQPSAGALPGPAPAPAVSLDDLARLYEPADAALSAAPEAATAGGLPTSAGAAELPLTAETPGALPSTEVSVSASEGAPTAGPAPVTTTTDDPNNTTVIYDDGSTVTIEAGEVVGTTSAGAPDEGGFSSAPDETAGFDQTQKEQATSDQVEQPAVLTSDEIQSLLDEISQGTSSDVTSNTSYLDQIIADAAASLGEPQRVEITGGGNLAGLPDFGAGLPTTAQEISDLNLSRGLSPEPSASPPSGAAGEGTQRVEVIGSKGAGFEAPPDYSSLVSGYDIPTLSLPDIPVGTIEPGQTGRVIITGGGTGGAPTLPTAPDIPIDASGLTSGYEVPNIDLPAVTVGTPATKPSTPTSPTGGLPISSSGVNFLQTAANLSQAEQTPFRRPGMLSATGLTSEGQAAAVNVLPQLKQLMELNPQLRAVAPDLLALLISRMRKDQGFSHGGQVHPHAEGGLPVFRTGGETGHGGRPVSGPGDGTSDDIPAMLADGEYVFSADVVSALGNGSNKAGSQALDKMVRNIRARARSGSPKGLPPKAKSPLSYLRSK